MARRFLQVLGILAGCSYLFVGCALYAYQRELLYPGRHNIVPTEMPRLPELRSFRVQTSSGESDAWYLPPLTDDATFPAMIFAHGNGEVIDIDEFRRWGMGVMLVEYPGYGRSTGTPTEAGIREAMVGAYDILGSQPGVDGRRIVGYGQSLGGGAVCALARDRRLAAMVLQSTFSSLRPFAHRFFMPEFLLADVFDNAEVVRSFDGPLLLVHGRHDELIPPAEAEALQRLAADGQLQLYECGHGCWNQDDLPLYKDMRAFLERHGVLRMSDGNLTPTPEC